MKTRTSNTRRLIDFLWDWELFWEYLRFGFAAAITAGATVGLESVGADRGWIFGVTFCGGALTEKWLRFCRS